MAFSLVLKLLLAYEVKKITSATFSCHKTFVYPISLYTFLCSLNNLIKHYCYL